MYKKYTIPSNTEYLRDIYTLMFSAALFITVKIWKQPKYPLAEEWVKSMWCLHTLKWYSVMKKRTRVPFGTTWVDFQGSMLGEVNIERQIVHDVTYL